MSLHQAFRELDFLLADIFYDPMVKHTVTYKIKSIGRKNK